MLQKTQNFTFQKSEYLLTDLKINISIHSPHNAEQYFQH